jgi:uncharacterized membrane protein YdjX (TVP38/TMEM64 family)
MGSSGASAYSDGSWPAYSRRIFDIVGRRMSTRWVLLGVALLAFILVPFVLFEDQFNALAADVARGEASTWYTGAAIAALLASDVFLPIPSSLVSAAAGVLLGFWWGSFVVWAGMTAACLIGYGFCVRASAAARRFVGPASLERGIALSARYGAFALILCRPVPVLAEASVIVAGILGTPFPRFVLLTAASNLGIAAVYAAIGAMSMAMNSFLLAFAAAMLAPGLAMLISRLWVGRRGSPRSRDDEAARRTRPLR